MTNPAPRTLPAPRLVFATLAAATLLSGCLSFGPKTPDSLLSLRPDAAPAANATRSGSAGSALTVLVPTVPQKLRTARVPVQSGGTAIAYVKDAQWVEAPARLFQRLLSETIAARGTRLVLDESQYVAAPGELLSGELLDFGIDADRGEAVVTYQALRLRGNGASITQRRFEAREPVSPVDAATSGAALNRAANRVAADVALWVGAGGG